MKQDEIIYKSRKQEAEKRLKRNLTVAEERKLYSDILTEFITEVSIPAAEESDLELAGLKD